MTAEIFVPGVRSCRRLVQRRPSSMLTLVSEKSSFRSLLRATDEAFYVIVGDVR